ncbi:MAG TPA: hypothetical protein VFZ65_13055 [Planctomycetota bacterium]|nr:hypothetical protein [Planctomycetota bacterium]
MDTISPRNQIARNPRVAASANGDKIVVWQQSDGVHEQIFKAEYRNRTWLVPASLADNISPDGQDAVGPTVAMDPNGDAVIAWQQSDGTSGQIFKSEYRGGSWSHPASLADNVSPDGTWASNPRVAMGQQGQTVIVWRQNDSSNHQQIFFSQYMNSVWMHPTGLSDHISPGATFVNAASVVSDDVGNFIVVWNQDVSAYSGVFVSEFRNGTWVHPTSLGSFISLASSESRYPFVAADRFGNAVIAWMQQTASIWMILKAEYNPTNGWTYPVSFADRLNAGIGDCDEPRVAADGLGGFVATWTQRDTTGQWANCLRERRGGSWIPPQNFFNPPGPGVGAGEVTSDGLGNYVFAWNQPDSSSIYRVYMSECRHGVWNHPTTLANAMGFPGSLASVSQRGIAGATDGTFLISWQQVVPPGIRTIFVAHYF